MGEFVDIAVELARLHILKGADFVRQLKMLAQLPIFHPVPGEHDIVTAGGEHAEDYEALLNAARKAVEHGIRYMSCPIPKALGRQILSLNGKASSRCMT